MTTYEKAIHLQNKPILPPDLSKPSQDLDNYLSTLTKECEEDDKKRLRYLRMTKTRQENAITIQEEEKKVVICKQEVIEDSDIVVSKRVGYKVTCPWCTYSWVWYGKKDRFFISCSRCHKSFKLNWRQKKKRY